MSQISYMTIHMFHGKPYPELGFQQWLLASKIKLYMRAGLNRAQANTSSMFGVGKNTRVRITSNRAMRSMKEQGL